MKQSRTGNIQSGATQQVKKQGHRDDRNRALADLMGIGKPTPSEKLAAQK